MNIENNKKRRRRRKPKNVSQIYEQPYYDPFYYQYPYYCNCSVYQNNVLNAYDPNCNNVLNAYDPRLKTCLHCSTEIDIKDENCDYCNWKNTHEVNIVLPTLPVINIEKKKVLITEKITSLRDLLDVIERYEYNEDCEYNINLKAIHNIKTELKELNDMIGLENLKQNIFQQIIYFLQDFQQESGEYKHTILYGPPGTGKTEIAMIIGRMFSKMGVLQNNIFKKVCRNDLIAGYLGQTAIKTKKVVEECIGGVLFIDEVYSLAPMNNETDIYSKECIDILCEALSFYKKDLMVIIAGYEKEIKDTIFTINQGFESRFIWRFSIEPYKATELKDIFCKKVLDIQWYLVGLGDSVRLEEWFRPKMKSFIFYGRDMEFLLSYIKIVHSIRVFGEPPETKKKISWEDLEGGYQMFLRNKMKKEIPEYMGFIYT
jgi:SpoVK/Ycf46/Vps4 family AAA+-type ATPase